ncbi:hypothetical protein Tsubulata_019028, partial [Turnera subulata]
MPLHYPRYTKKDYEAMPQWKLYNLLVQYGLPTTGDLAEKRETAMGTFLWVKNENRETTNITLSKKNSSRGHFQMPLHYPRYTRKDFETMDEAKLDQLFVAYGLPTDGDLGYKRKSAMSTFLGVKSYVVSRSSRFVSKGSLVSRVTAAAVKQPAESHFPSFMEDVAASQSVVESSAASPATYGRDAVVAMDVELPRLPMPPPPAS